VQTGARESKVNIVEDETPKRPEDVFIGTDPDLGRRTVVVGLVGVVLALALEVALFRIGLGATISRWLRAEIGSPIAAAVITNVVPLAGLGLGWLIEVPFRPNEELVPGFHLRLRSGLWTIGSTLGVAYVIVSLLR
jgi:hypothetical protein